MEESDSRSCEGRFPTWIYSQGEIRYCADTTGLTRVTGKQRPILRLLSKIRGLPECICAKIGQTAVSKPTCPAHLVSAFVLLVLCLPQRPHTDCKRDSVNQVTEIERNEAVAKLDVYRQWILERVFCSRTEHTLMVVPIENLSPRYRDEFPK